MAAFFSILFAGCVAEIGEPIDLEAERAAILEADQAWSETPLDVQAFVSYFADGARFQPPEGPEAVGLEDIQGAAAAVFSLPGFSVSCRAHFSDVSSARDLGYSIGTLEFTANDTEGHPVTRNGKYTTVWRKQKDGQWKVVSDTFNFNSPAPIGEGYVDCEG